VHDKAFYDTRDNHVISMWIILDMKIILRKGDRNMGPLGPNVGSLDIYMLHPSLGLFLLLLVNKFEARAPVMGSTSFSKVDGAYHPLCRGLGCFGRGITGGGRQC
jgi:hypothetical protein